MLSTEWVAPGTGSTIRELLNAAPAYIVDGSEWASLRLILERRTSLRLIEDRELQAYDFERMSEAVRRILEEA